MFTNCPQLQKIFLKNLLIFVRKYVILFTYKRAKGGDRVSPRTGRPTDDPKKNRLELRLSDHDAEKLDFCCKALGLSKAEVIRRGIDRVYQEATKK